MAWDIHCPNISSGAFFSKHSRIFPETQQPAKVWVTCVFCSYHKYPLCVAPDTMKWWMRSLLAFPKSRSGFLLQSDPKQIVGMSWALLLSLTQLLFELLNSFINLSPISKTRGVRKWWTTLTKAGRRANLGLFNAQIPTTAAAICLFPEQKSTWEFLCGE